MPFGVLLEPLLGLISGLGEGIIWLIQNQLLGLEVSNIYVTTSDGDFWSGLAGVLSGLAAGGAVIAGVLLSPITFGTSAVVAAGAAGVIVGVNVGTFVGDQFPDNFFLPVYKISPQEIFSNQVPALSVNFINPEDPDDTNSGILGFLTNIFTGSNEDEQSDEDNQSELQNMGLNTAAVLSPYIAKWYVALRNLVLVGLMVVLLYIGIRIVISSTAGEKAKYKEHIKDWIIAVIIVIFMHYIMAFALTITEYIIGMLNTQNQVPRIEISEENANAIVEAVGGGDTSAFKDPNDGKYYIYTNLMGYARIQQQLDTRDDKGNTQFSWNYIGYTIIYFVFVIYTVMFLIIYLKRVVYMAFLTVIAPLVALTYPIDKISDGQAQAFNMWLKEYIYNLLLQPFHLLLYTLLVGSAIDLATKNMLYSIVAMGFLIPAEQLLRRFFGFDQKAPEAGSIVGGVVGGSMAMNAINNLRRIGSVGQKRNSEKTESFENNRGKTRLVENNRKPSEGKKQSMEELLNEPRTVGPASNTVREQPENVSTVGEQSRGYDRTDSGIYIPRQEQALQIERTTTSNNLVTDDDVTNGYGQTDSGIYIPRQEQALQLERQINGNTAISPTERTSIKSPQTVENSNIKKKKISKARAIAGTAAHYTGKGLAAVGKRAPRMMTKAVLGATLGTAGVAAGVATGDWSNIATYGAAAAGVGASLGEGVSNVAGNIGTGTENLAKGIRSDYESRAYTKAERTERENARADKEWRKNKDVIRKYKDEYGADYKTAMDTALKFREYGITDDKAIIKKMNSIGINATPTGRDIAATKAASTIRNEEQLRGLSDRLRNNGVPEREIIRLEDDVRKMNVSGEFV